MTTAVRPVRVGLDDVLLGDGALAAMIGTRAYVESQKPEGAQLPFISYGTPYETDFATFSTPGNTGTRILHLYGDDEDVVEVMFGHVKRIGAAGFAVTGHAMLVFTSTLLSVAADPGGGAHGVVRVAYTTREA